MSYLEAHQFGPVDSTLLRRVLEEVRADWWKIRPWLQPGQSPRAGPGEDLHGLLEVFRHSEFWPAASRSELRGTALSSAAGGVTLLPPPGNSGPTRDRLLRRHRLGRFHRPKPREGDEPALAADTYLRKP